MMPGDIGSGASRVQVGGSSAEGRSDTSVVAAGPIRRSRKLRSRAVPFFFVVGGQAVGQICLIGAIPVLTRYYPPDEIGFYQLALALGSILQPIATLRVEFIIPAVGRRGSVRKLLRWSRWSQMVTTIILLAAAATLLFIGARVEFEIAVMAAVTMIAYSWMSVDSALLVRNGQLNRLGLRNALAGIAAASLQIASVWISQEIWVIALCLLAGRMAALLATRPRRAIPTKSNDRKEEPDEADQWTVKRAAYAVLSGVTSAGTLQILVIYAGVSFGTAEAAYMGVAQRASAAPLALLGLGLSQYSQAALAPLVRANQRGRLRAQLKKQILLLTPLAVIVSVALIALGPTLGSWAFGEGWQDVGTLLALLAIPTGLQLLIAPVTPLFLMLARERLLLGIQIGRLFGSVVLAVAFQMVTGEFFWAVGGYSIGLTIGYLVTGGWLFILLGSSKRRA